MTGWWDDHRPFTIALLTWAVGGLLFLLIVRLPFGGAIAELRADEGSRAELQRFYQDPEAGASAARPHDEARRRLTTVRQELLCRVQARQGIPHPGGGHRARDRIHEAPRCSHRPAAASRQPGRRRRAVGLRPANQ